MLNLIVPTKPEWVQVAADHLDALLSDHAHCELKAAQSALSLVGRYGGEAPQIVEPLVALAHEETTHFHQVHEKLTERNSTFHIPTSDVYVRELQAAAKKDGQKVPRFLDRLLVCALIEGRSCERFRLLSEQLPTEEMRTFYHELMVSEARHYRLFSSLAEELFGRVEAKNRFRALAEREGEIVEKLPLEPTVHG